MEILLSISCALMAGLLMSRVVKPLGLPAVTGYLIAGVIIGPYCLGLLGIEGLGFLSMEYVEKFGLISDVALGFIAFSIGNEFRLSDLKKTGKQATVIGIFQALVATLFVDLALIALSFILGEDVLPKSVCITLGAVATATAPAATLMVVRQYKAKGKLTDILLPIVALDDAVGLIVFAVSFGISKAMVRGEMDIVSIVVNPILEIVVSLILGAVMGYIFSEMEKLFHSRSKRLSVSVTFVFLTVALTMIKIELGSVILSASPLLTCMMLGTVFCNVCESSEELMDRVDRWTTPLFILFFVISGAELELSVFTSLAAVLIGIVYILFRSLGKITGATFSARLMKCDEQIVKHLGITLLPQAGVALGMSVTAMQLGDYEGGLIRNIILFSVLIYELVGPIMTKNALIKAGEIIPEGRKSAKVLNIHRKK
ncbi:MAG: sodium:proton antiporter [Ruminococcaceae bacterium]|nr:sodium:proton antiporter [Oscillospiraceae bacterium]